MKPIDLIHKAAAELKQTAANPLQESLWLLADELKLPQSSLYLKGARADKKQERAFLYKIQKRKKGYPLEYILKEKIFYNKAFYVEEGVFIPREDTESIVDWLAANFKKTKFSAADFGAGCGALSLSLLSLFPKSLFTAVEQSAPAVKCLKKNRRRFQFGRRLRILKKDVIDLASEDFTSPLSLIAANPPYIDPKDKSLSPEIYFEPAESLFSGEEGMRHIKLWFKKAMNLLNPQGVYIFEIGWKQKVSAVEFLEKQKELASFKIGKDKAGRPRMAVCFKK